MDGTARRKSDIELTCNRASFFSSHDLHDVLNLTFISRKRNDETAVFAYKALRGIEMV